MRQWLAGACLILTLGITSHALAANKECTELEGVSIEVDESKNGGLKTTYSYKIEKPRREYFYEMKEVYFSLDGIFIVMGNFYFPNGGPCVVFIRPIPVVFVPEEKEALWQKRLRFAVEILELRQKGQLPAGPLVIPVFREQPMPEDTR